MMTTTTKTVLCLTLLLAAAAICPSANAQPEKPTRPPEDIYVGPRWGWGGYFTGLGGAEAQMHHFALALGIAPDMGFDMEPGFCGGVKYYLDPQRSSFYVGICAGRIQQLTSRTQLGSDGVTTVVSDYTRYKTTYGIGCGYRWRIGFGLDFSAGIGGGIQETSYEGIVHAAEDESGSHFAPLLDLSMGFSF